LLCQDINCGRIIENAYHEASIGAAVVEEKACLGMKQQSVQKIKLTALAVIELHLSEGISK